MSLEPLRLDGVPAFVSYDPHEDTFVGKVHGLSEDLLFRGDSLEELKANFKSVLEDFYARTASEQYDIIKQYSGFLELRVGSQLHKKLADEAAANYQTVPELAVEILQDYLY